MYLTPEDYEIASRNGIDRENVYNRVNKLFWDKQRAITEPLQPKVVAPEWQRNKATCLESGISNKVFMARIKLGWKEDRAATEPVKRMK